MLASSVTGKHTNYNTYKAALDSMVKLILLQCLEMCLPLHAVTLIQSRHGYKISVFLVSSLFFVSLCSVILSTSGIRFLSLGFLING